MKKYLLVISLSFSLFACKRDIIPVVTLITEPIKQSYLEENIYQLADDDMLGRGSANGGVEIAGAFIIEAFNDIGLAPREGANDFKQVFEYTVSNELKSFHNIIGVIPGKSLKDEIVVFSAHYDHIGWIPPLEGDSIANGANDNASGTAALLALARLFKEADIHERTLMFIAFAAEEVGLVGSYYFADQVDTENIVAAFNIDMIGNISPYGANTAYITGYDRSDFGSILQKNLVGTPYKIEKEPYPENPLRLFYRSDNYPLAKKGIPAHTITTFNAEDTLYHTVNDEVETIHMESITEIVREIRKRVKSLTIR